MLMSGFAGGIMRIVVVIALFTACVVSVASQEVFGQTKPEARAQAIADAFSKQKHVLKAKHGVSREKFKDVRSELVVRQNAAEYAGTYEIEELGFVINLQVGSDGRIHGNGSEQGEQTRSFKLENAKIEGALLTAAKVYPNGASETFEGVFLKRTVRHAANDPGTTTIGLGVVLATPFEQNGLTYDKLFYQFNEKPKI
jgi:hypothetical protein